MKWRNLAIGLLVFVACFAAGQWLAPRAMQTYAQWFPEPDFELADNSRWFAGVSEPVVMFGTSTCPWCQRAREVLTELKVPFHEHRIDESPQAQALFTELGAQGVPVILVGNRRIQGFREDALREAVSLLAAPATAARQ